MISQQCHCSLNALQARVVYEGKLISRPHRMSLRDYDHRDLKGSVYYLVIKFVQTKIS